MIGTGSASASSSTPRAWRTTGYDPTAQKQLVATAYADAGWETPTLLKSMWEAQDMYFDTLSQIHMDRWSTGRVALLGDAAWCAGPGGSGTGMAMMGAHVLAGELAAADGDHTAAFAAYERILRPAAKIGQKQGKGSGGFLAPIDDKKIASRNKAYKMLTKKMVAGFFNWLTGRAANAVEVQGVPGGGRGFGSGGVDRAGLAERGLRDRARIGSRADRSAEFTSPTDPGV